eukprot:509235_1
MANQANNVNPLSEPLLPPIHLHITTIRPKECDISWSPPIELSQYKLGYNIQVFKEENHDDNKAMQDWSISNTTWKISNLEPKTYYAIHIHSLLKANNIWTKSEEPSIIKFWTAPTQKDAKKIIPDPPEQPKEVAMDDQRLRHPKKQKNNEIIVWKSPEKFRGKISYKISWNSDLLGVTENTYVDLGNKNRVGIKFKYMYQQKRRQYEYNEDEDDNDNNYSSHSEDDNKYDHISNKIKLTLKSQTYYKGKSSESMEKCEVKLIDIEPYNNNNNNIISNHRQNPMNNNQHNNFSSQNNNNNFMNNNFDEDREIKAPPKSSAADLLAKLEQTEGAFIDNESERIACRQCGRKFSQIALQKHIKICKKVFGQKRKQFNIQRTDDDAKNAARNTDQHLIEMELKKKKKKSKENWKSQSTMLREAIRASKQIEQALKSGKSLSDIPHIPSSVPDNRVPCPHCGRKFAEETAKRHIPKCQNIKSRPKALKRRR